MPHRGATLVLACLLGPQPGVQAAAAVGPVAGPGAALPSVFAKVFSGLLGGKLPVRLQLERRGGRLSGTYSYRRVEGSLLGLRGEIQEDGRFGLEELDEGRTTGLFKGRLTRQVAKGLGLLRIAGTWSRPDGSRPLGFDILEEHFELDGEAVVYETVASHEEKPGYMLDLALPRFEAASADRLAGLNGAIESLTSQQAADFRKAAEEWSRDNPPDPTQKPDEASEMSLGYEVVGASPDVVSLQFFTFSSFPRTVHPSHSLEVLNYGFQAERALDLADLFRPGSDYLKRIADYCLNVLKPDESWREGLAPKPENYALWSLTPEGLQVLFEEYQAGPYVAGSRQVTIPYRALAGVLREDGPAAAYLR
jgi:Protein of unknown function (DUF3298)